MLIDVDIGLGVGVLASLLVVMMRGFLPQLTVLQKCRDLADVWLDRNIYKTDNNGAMVLQVNEENEAKLNLTSVSKLW